MIEGTFGLLASKWRLLLRNIDTSPEKCDALVQAVCCLHNYLIAEGEIFTGPGGETEEFDAELPQAAHLRNPHANFAGNLADLSRRNLLDYFSVEGAVEWQDEYSHVNLLTQQ